MFGFALPDRWRRKARPALPDASGTVERFLSAPFVKRNRIPDTMKSLEKLQAGLAK